MCRSLFKILGAPRTILSLCFLLFNSPFFKKRAQKTGTELKQSFCALFTSRKRHSSVAQNLSQTTFRSTIGERTTRYSRNNSIAGYTAQTYPLRFPMFERLIVVFQTVPNIFKITSAGN